ncbi:circularly permuted type 2 ATP-grasp protein [Reinekea marinisedimentorum]|uniref:Putative circularly permuted ATP-grasp superfamily protein n=1 Tax=Reinekea marinisedimentorum TaxID=230495 RepID=A0A4R3IC73_9GAMM|nr:circularly permuted type 2 ATP-grasp protein [Reinekea marinisedimentorum]TCS43263.1 putative circularly permuted ATP-grasp superfamily protein [Reinekea marinisedimentorum]
MQDQKQGLPSGKPLFSDNSEIASWYQTPDQAFDEVFLNPGESKPHWRYFVDSMNRAGLTQFADRQRKAQDILRDDGATYNRTENPLQTSTWSLDPFPYLLGSEEWTRLEAAMVERSQLMNLILKDIYGDRELIRRGIVPAEVIYGHPGFLRQCQGVSLPGENQLLMHAMNMVRGLDGEFTVVGDRTQAPTGSGYALENRRVLSRVLPDMFRDSNVHRLSHYFYRLRQTLTSLGRRLNPNPRVVVLTTGANSSSHFEQAYLSNYLGYSLVQGTDLTVRNGRVWLKALGGLQQVDVILRRVDDVYCDQVELSSGGRGGVPGLLEVVREGNVIVANPLGSGILETPALLKFLPQIAQHFLGHDLAVKSVESWWCGDTDDYAYVTHNLSNLIIKPAVRRDNSRSIYGRELTEEQKAQLLVRIARNPHLYVAQSYLKASHSPTWQQGKIVSCPTIIRTFTVSNLDSYFAMPGGLARVTKQHAAQEYVDTRHEVKSKDIWVLSDAPETYFSLIDEHQDILTDIDLQNNLPSRVIENLFWMGRYSERAETVIRLLRTVFHQLQDSDPLPEASRDVLLKALSVQTGSLPGFCAEGNAAIKNADAELISLIIDGNRPGSVKANINSMLNCSEEVREMLSADTRKIVNDLRDDMGRLEKLFAKGMPTAPQEALDDIVTSLLALSGLNHESMMRGIDWRFQAIGRRVERAIQTATLLQSTLTEGLSAYDMQRVLESVLLSVEALISFRRRYRTRYDVYYGLDLLMLDETNPRSLFYQIDALNKHTMRLPRSTTSARAMSHELKVLSKSLADMQLSDLHELSGLSEKTNRREKLDELMQTLIHQLEQYTGFISDKYFDHMTKPHQIFSPNWELEA